MNIDVVKAIDELLSFNNAYILIVRESDYVNREIINTCADYILKGDSRIVVDNLGVPLVNNLGASREKADRNNPDLIEEERRFTEEEERRKALMVAGARVFQPIEISRALSNGYNAVIQVNTDFLRISSNNVKTEYKMESRYTRRMILVTIFRDLIIILNAKVPIFKNNNVYAKIDPMKDNSVIF